MNSNTAYLLKVDFNALDFYDIKISKSLNLENSKYFIEDKGNVVTPLLRAKNCPVALYDIKSKEDVLKYHSFLEKSYSILEMLSGNMKNGSAEYILSRIVTLKNTFPLILNSKVDTKYISTRYKIKTFYTFSCEKATISNIIDIATNNNTQVVYLDGTEELIENAKIFIHTCYVYIIQHQDKLIICNEETFYKKSESFFNGKFDFIPSIIFHQHQKYNYFNVLVYKLNNLIIPQQTINVYNVNVEEGKKINKHSH